jgi:hypothetical protein
MTTQLHCHRCQAPIELRFAYCPQCGGYLGRGLPVTPPAARRPAARRRTLEIGVEDILAVLEEERARHLPGVREKLLFPLWMSFLPIATWVFFWSIANANTSNALLSLGGIGFVLMLRHLTASEKQTEAARMLARFDDVRAMGALIEALDWPEEQVRVAARLALLRLLPRLRASDATLLRPGQRASLYRYLKMRNAHRDVDFLLAILKALEQVGDASALPPVQRLAEGAGHTYNQRRVRRAARECLPYLEARAEQQRASQTLLRASSAVATTPQMLLRPATGGNNAEPQQLLRPGAQENAL